jgi:hypothetical protein
MRKALFASWLIAALPLMVLPGCGTVDTTAVADTLTAPKWDVQQASFPDHRYRLTLTMDRIYAGGAGEARVVFNQRAESLMLENGFDGYTVLEYTEGLHSSIMGSQRVAQGTIQLTRKGG